MPSLRTTLLDFSQGKYVLCPIRNTRNMLRSNKGSAQSEECSEFNISWIKQLFLAQAHRFIIMISAREASILIGHSINKGAFFCTSNFLFDRFNV